MGVSVCLFCLALFFFCLFGGGGGFQGEGIFGGALVFCLWGVIYIQAQVQYYIFELKTFEL